MSGLIHTSDMPAPRTVTYETWFQLAEENKVLRLKAASSLANNLCPDHRDKQGGKPCLACEIERLTSERDRIQHKYERACGRYDELRRAIEKGLNITKEPA